MSPLPDDPNDVIAAYAKEKGVNDPTYGRPAGRGSSEDVNVPDSTAADTVEQGRSWHANRKLLFGQEVLGSVTRTEKDASLEHTLRGEMARVAVQALTNANTLSLRFGHIAGNIDHLLGIYGASAFGAHQGVELQTRQQAADASFNPEAEEATNTVTTAVLAEMVKDVKAASAGVAMLSERIAALEAAKG